MAVDRRKQILEAAAKSFALFGYKATTMDQVAKIANVGKGTIYTFFTNKEQLFDQIVQQVIQEMKQIADREIDPDKPFFENLYRVLDRVLDFRAKHELIIKLSHELREFGTPMANSGLDKVEQAMLAYIEREVAQAVAKKEIRPVDPKVTAFIMLKLYTALTSQWSHANPPLRKEEIQRHFQIHLIEGLAR
ncbi:MULTISPECIES: TetR/AcrR family transcriptional regulator [unclassified Paenibacillus]|uniref:TetR/AcrR family transcriptional regulator n=1 Tax=unclassified Paenibacillus TaxID=185978 RepID=UPI001C10245D|nr:MULTISPECIES: TetR/AcrR family transcriptional regulator [unclassified Paenibacillus]MBU5443482.1 TetR/AcrR family transcriptional regulator [Paenibacillus sp. MSJ-34]CAH0119368.1 hypothetical protein PAE9249_01868 [Paenibacillus sp. CECT 9249]